MKNSQSQKARDIQGKPERVEIATCFCDRCIGETPHLVQVYDNCDEKYTCGDCGRVTIDISETAEMEEPCAEQS